MPLLMAVLLAFAGIQDTAPAGLKSQDPALETPAQQERPDRVRGATIRWTWTEGPVAGTTHEHVFHDDGTVTWRVVDGPAAGHQGTEETYTAMAVSEDVVLVSYLAASGFTLTVVLDFSSGTMAGIASGQGQWHSGRGTFEVVGEG